MKKEKPLQFSYNEQEDVLTVEGKKYAGLIFRSWSDKGIPLNKPFVITDRDHGTLTLKAWKEIRFMLTRCL